VETTDFKNFKALDSRL